MNARAMLALALCAAAAAACARRPARTIRVCADPNNLPYSNREEQGFENRIASLLAADRHATLEYTWWAQRRGFVRNTLEANACDVVIGVPSRFEPALTTRPYYRSAYVFVTKALRPSGVTTTPCAPGPVSTVFTTSKRVRSMTLTVRPGAFLEP